MRKRLVLLVLLGWLALGVSGVWAGSDVPYAKDFKNWKVLKTYKFPCDKLQEMPKVIQELGVMLCPLLTPESKVIIYVRPEAEKVLKSGGEYPDGINFAYFVTNVKGVGDVVLFKAHDLGEAKYGVYKTDGTDIEGAVKLLKKSTCISCHNVWCAPAGVCANQPWNTIK